MTLRIGIYDLFFRPSDPSITWQQQPPAYWQWVDNADVGVDVAMATWGSWDRLRNSRHPRRVLYLQETAEVRKHPPREVMDDYDLVISNDVSLVESLGERGAWCSLFGVRMPPSHYETPPPKTRPVSLMGSMLRGASGHQLRWRVFEDMRDLVEPYGFAGETYWKRDSLADYYFQVAIESANYDGWATEKLWDAFALRTVPIYWGGVTDSRLRSWGFDPAGIIRWDSLDTLRTILEFANKSPESFYGLMRGAVEHNRNRVLELRCGEQALAKVLCEKWPDLAEKVA